MPPIEVTINRQLLVSKVAELLYQLRIIPESSEITDIVFSDLFGKGSRESCKLKILTRSEGRVEKGVKVIIHNYEEA